MRTDTGAIVAKHTGTGNTGWVEVRPPAYGSIRRVGVVTNWNTNNAWHDINAWTAAGPTRGVTANIAGTLTVAEARDYRDYEISGWCDVRLSSGINTASMQARIMQGGAVLIDVLSRATPYDGSTGDVIRFVFARQFTAAASDVLKLMIRSEINDTGGTFDVLDGDLIIKSID